MRATLIFCTLLLLTGCASLSCGADREKLSHLRPGMSREETSQLMGCAGKPVGDESRPAGSFRTVEWSGPGSLLMSRTYVVFLNDRVYMYDTDRRGRFSPRPTGERFAAAR